MRRAVALCGGIGGAKLALGLAQVLPGEALTIVVNTGDDFEHLGLHISPDIDTVIYTLAGLSDPGRGWGRADESWRFMEELGRLGAETWFQLGDRDLAIHVERTWRLRAAETLSNVTSHLAARLGVGCTILPMSDDPVRTVIETDMGALDFQTYFVRERAEPPVRKVWFAGAEAARPTPAVVSALSDPELAAVIVCPSNPFLSIGPILSIPPLRDLVTTCPAPVVAVSPLVGGRAVKGPTARNFADLGHEPGLPALVTFYDGLLNGLVVDLIDADQARALSLPTRVVQTVMTSNSERKALARTVMDFAASLEPTVG